MRKLTGFKSGPLERVFQDYGQKRSKFPLKTYLIFLSAYNLLLGSLVARGNIAKREKPELSGIDLALLGVATHKLSRIVTKDVVTAPLRAPFTRYEELLGYGEVQEDGRGNGLRQVIGELLSCNYCADPWVALSFAYGLDLFPKKTRFLLRFFSAIALADFLHVFYEMMRTRENALTLREERLERGEKKAA